MLHRDNESDAMKVPPRSTVRDLDVIVAGVSNIDIIGRTIDLKHPPPLGALQTIESVSMTTGGVVSNVAIDLATLGFRVGVVSRIGKDSFGGFLRSRLEMHGIFPEGIVVDPGRQTSATIVTVAGNGERTFFHARGSMENFRVEDVLEQMDVVRRGRLFVFGYFGLLPECDASLGHMFRSVRQKTGMLSILDAGAHPGRDASLLQTILPEVDFFFPSRDEACALTGEKEPQRIVAAFRDAGARGVVGVKLGAEGCYVSWEKRARRVPARKVRKVIDTTGAGDAFIAGFSAGVLEGLDPFAAAALGNDVAASSLGEIGASTGIKPLKKYLRNRKH